ADAPASPLEIPREPIAFSYLVAGLLQVDHPTRQRLLETPAADARLAALDRLLEREIDLLGQGLLPHLPDPRLVGTNRN
ncbi:MAG TPA: hypothetical protein VNJ28_07815, partial [Candidatus Limnocylindrales bacterium]|nr:hypothetical protein [Candidatus Limnocylindrales bacterium]